MQGREVDFSSMPAPDMPRIYNDADDVEARARTELYEAEDAEWRRRDEAYDAGLTSRGRKEEANGGGGGGAAAAAASKRREFEEDY